MDRDSILELIRLGPVRIKMNNGDTFDVPSIEFATVSDLTAAVLVRSEDGKLRHRLLSLVAICSVEPLASTADNS
ncbi:MAG: hypothetical protein ACRCT8_13680 [Lacipirellulaceae bacterium]